MVFITFGKSLTKYFSFLYTCTPLSLPQTPVTCVFDRLELCHNSVILCLFNFLIIFFPLCFILGSFCSCVLKSTNLFLFVVLPAFNPLPDVSHCRHCISHLQEFDMGLFHIFHVSASSFEHEDYKYVNCFNILFW